MADLLVNAPDLAETMLSPTPPVVLDVRWQLGDSNGHDHYLDGHIPGAISIPVPELKARLKELPKRREIVAYCRGPYCVMAIEAVELLRKNGFKAQRMEQGVVDFRARGWRVAVEREGAAS